MRTVTLKSVLEMAVAIDGEGGNTLSATDLAALGPVIDRWVRSGWRFAWWAETMETQLRAFRDAWALGSYAEGAQVYHADSGLYYEAGSAITTEVPGTDAEWVLITELEAYVAWEQSGATVIEPGATRAIYRDNPALVERPRHVRWRELAAGPYVYGSEVPAQVYLEFRRETPSYATTPYDATESVTTGARRYLDSTGECYKAIQAGTGKDPATETAYWAVVEFPEFLKTYVAHGIYVDVLRGDGQNSKSLAETGYGERYLLDELASGEMSGGGRVPRRAAFSR